MSVIVGKFDIYIYFVQPLTFLQRYSHPQLGVVAKRCVHKDHDWEWSRLKFHFTPRIKTKNFSCFCLEFLFYVLA